VARFAEDILLTAKDEESGHLERWLQSRLQQRITSVTSALDELKTRTALQLALFETWNDLRWYIQRKGKPNTRTFAEAVKAWLKMLAPFAPFTCEETWNRAGEADFITVAQWPKADVALVDVTAVEQENFVVDLMDDTLNILKATKITPKRVCVYTAAAWKRLVYVKVLERAVVGEVKMGEIMRELSADEELKPHMKEVASLVPRVIKAVAKLSVERRTNLLKMGAMDEKGIVEDAVGFLRDRFSAEVFVYGENDITRYDPKVRARMAMPGQPAIYIE
jgi:leucyl-tRNA synthetase